MRLHVRNFWERNPRNATVCIEGDETSVTTFAQFIRDAKIHRTWNSAGAELKCGYAALADSLTLVRGAKMSQTAVERFHTTHTRYKSLVQEKFQTWGATPGPDMDEDLIDDFERCEELSNLAIELIAHNIGIEEGRNYVVGFVVAQSIKGDIFDIRFNETGFLPFTPEVRREVIWICSDNAAKLLQGSTTEPKVISHLEGFKLCLPAVPPDASLQQGGKPPPLTSTGSSLHSDGTTPAEPSANVNIATSSSAPDKQSSTSVPQSTDHKIANASVAPSTRLDQNSLLLREEFKFRSKQDEERAASVYGGRSMFAFERLPRPSATAIYYVRKEFLKYGVTVASEINILPMACEWEATADEPRDVQSTGSVEMVDPDEVYASEADIDDRFDFVTRRIYSLSIQQRSKDLSIRQEVWNTSSVLLSTSSIAKRLKEVELSQKHREYAKKSNKGLRASRVVKKVVATNKPQQREADEEPATHQAKRRKTAITHSASLKIGDGKANTATQQQEVDEDFTPHQSKQWKTSTAPQAGVGKANTATQQQEANEESHPHQAGLQMTSIAKAASPNKMQQQQQGVEVEEKGSGKSRTYQVKRRETSTAKAAIAHQTQSQQYQQQQQQEEGREESSTHQSKRRKMNTATAATPATANKTKQQQETDEEPNARPAEPRKTSRMQDLGGATLQSTRSSEGGELAKDPKIPSCAVESPDSRLPPAAAEPCRPEEFQSEELFPCPWANHLDCQKVMRKSMMIRHLLDHHPNEKDIGTPCQLGCGRRFPSRAWAERHVHPISGRGQAAFYCEVAAAACRDSKRRPCRWRDVEGVECEDEVPHAHASRHEKKCHSDNEFGYRCNHCERTFSDLYARDFHVVMDHAAIPYAPMPPAGLSSVAEASDARCSTNCHLDTRKFIDELARDHSQPNQQLQQDFEEEEFLPNDNAVQNGKKYSFTQANDEFIKKAYSEFDKRIGGRIPIKILAESYGKRFPTELRTPGVLKSHIAHSSELKAMRDSYPSRSHYRQQREQQQRCHKEGAAPNDNAAEQSEKEGALTLRASDNDGKKAEPSDSAAQPSKIKRQIFGPAHDEFIKEAYPKYAKNHSGCRIPMEKLVKAFNKAFPNRQNSWQSIKCRIKRSAELKATHDSYPVGNRRQHRFRDDGASSSSDDAVDQGEEQKPQGRCSKFSSQTDNDEQAVRQDSDPWEATASQQRNHVEHEAENEKMNVDSTSPDKQGKHAPAGTASGSNKLRARFAGGESYGRSACRKRRPVQNMSDVSSGEESEYDTTRGDNGHSGNPSSIADGARQKLPIGVRKLRRRVVVVESSDSEDSSDSGDVEESDNGGDSEESGEGSDREETGEGSDREESGEWSNSEGSGDGDGDDREESGNGSDEGESSSGSDTRKQPSTNQAVHYTAPTEYVDEPDEFPLKFRYPIDISGGTKIHELPGNYDMTNLADVKRVAMLQRQYVRRAKKKLGLPLLRTSTLARKFLHANDDYIKRAYADYAKTHSGGRIPLKTLAEGYHKAFPTELRTQESIRCHVAHSAELKAVRDSY